MTKALVLLADGTEEMEAVIVIDTLRRARWDVVAAGVTDTTITASRGVKIVCDTTLQAVKDSAFDVLVLPGGAGGTRIMSAHAEVLALVRTFVIEGRVVGAICAAPLILQAAGLLEGRRVTCHPAVQTQLTQTTPLQERVVIDGKLITSQGPGTTFEFALAIIASVDGSEAARTVRAGLVL